MNFTSRTLPTALPSPCRSTSTTTSAAPSSNGVFVNGTPVTSFQDAGWANGGALSGFSYTFTNSKLEANQTAAGTFTYAGSPRQAGAALGAAGFGRYPGTEGGTEYRSRGSFWTGADSGHFIVNPKATLPTVGDEHFGEHNPFTLFGWAPHCLSEKGGICSVF